MTDLISVIMPVLNCARTLHFALSSLRAQTYVEWECIVVDDGSSDQPDAVIDEIHDPRIIYYRLGKNYGRGAARQYALELANGKYITFLDGDDWIYPDKFRLQLNALDDDHDICAVSTGMAIADVEDRLAGIRNTTEGGITKFGTMRGPGMPPLAFAPSMMHAEIAHGTRFDPSFPISEDADFLLRALLGRKYAVLPRALYVYREQKAMTLQKVSSALNYCCRMFEKQLYEFPVEGTVEIVKARGKQMIYHAAAKLSFWDQIIRRRSRKPNELEHQQYRAAWETVSEVAASHSMSTC
jgi:glycosyltransferase involved in cell wall biosynthesis